jgi:hypothetical protein
MMTRIIEPTDNNLILLLGLIFLVVDALFLASPFVLDRLSHADQDFARLLSPILDSLLATSWPVPGLLAILGLLLIAYAIIDKLNWW